MAWVTSGTLIAKSETRYKYQIDQKNDTIITKNGDVSCDTTCCLAVVLDSESDGVKKYVIKVYAKKTGGLQDKGKATITTTTEHPNKSEEPTTQTRTFDNFNALGTFSDGINSTFSNFPDLP